MHHSAGRKRDMTFDHEGTLDLGGDLNLLQDLIQSLIEDSPVLWQQTLAGLREQSAEEIERAARGLTELAANFGTLAPVKPAPGLEPAGPAGGNRLGAEESFARFASKGIRLQKQTHTS